MPFAQAEYERDFHEPAALEPGSPARFRALLPAAQEGPGLAVLDLKGRNAP